MAQRVEHDSPVEPLVVPDPVSDPASGEARDPNVARFAHRARDPAPDSPRIVAWQRRILGWGCAPAMAVGLVSGLAGAARPELAQTMAMIGTGLAILVAGPITLHTWRMRRDNARRWEQAHRAAADQGLQVRVVTTDEGDHDYQLVEGERIERIDWEARERQREQAAASAEHDSASIPGSGAPS